MFVFKALVVGPLKKNLFAASLREAVKNNVILVARHWIFQKNKGHIAWYTGLDTVRLHHGTININIYYIIYYIAETNEKYASFFIFEHNTN